jgi:FMN-dependent NADH-azoreductase
LAWLRATCPDASVRRGKEAVDAARRACELAKWKKWYCVGTLGAAYAEAGSFEKAIKYQKQALSMQGVPDKDRIDMRQRLRLYEQQIPFHEGPKLQ